MERQHQVGPHRFFPNMTTIYPIDLSDSDLGRSMVAGGGHWIVSIVGSNAIPPPREQDQRRGELERANRQGCYHGDVQGLRCDKAGKS